MSKLPNKFFEPGDLIRQENLPIYHLLLSLKAARYKGEDCIFFVWFDLSQTKIVEEVIHLPMAKHAFKTLKVIRDGIEI